MKAELLSLVKTNGGDPATLRKHCMVQPLAGDASTRSYFRLRLGATSAVLMRLPEHRPASEGFLAGQVRALTGEQAFLAVRDLLASCEVPTLEIVAQDLPGRWLLLSDLGDDLLLDRLEAEPSSAGHWYRKALGNLDRMQRSATSGLRALAAPRYTEALLHWELEHFLQYGLGHSFPEHTPQGLALELLSLAPRLAKLPTTFTHRDYHCRNLMVYRDELHVIDFQDALLGPSTYDLASLLRDSYLLLEEALVDELVVEFHERTILPVIPSWSLARFVEDFHLTALQRNLKAWGRFRFFSLERGNDAYLRYIPTTIRQIKRFARFYNELDRVLTAHCEEYRRI